MQLKRMWRPQSQRNIQDRDVESNTWDSGPQVTVLFCSVFFIYTSLCTQRLYMSLYRVILRTVSTNMVGRQPQKGVVTSSNSSVYISVPVRDSDQPNLMHLPRPAVGRQALIRDKKRNFVGNYKTNSYHCLSYQSSVKRKRYLI